MSGGQRPERGVAATAVTLPGRHGGPAPLNKQNPEPLAAGPPPGPCRSAAERTQGPAGREDARGSRGRLAPVLAAAFSMLRCTAVSRAA